MIDKIEAFLTRIWHKLKPHKAKFGTIKLPDDSVWQPIVCDKGIHVDSGHVTTGFVGWMLGEPNNAGTYTPEPTIQILCLQTNKLNWYDKENKYERKCCNN